MKFSLNWLKEYVDIVVTPEKLADELSLHSLEIEGVEKREGDTLIDVALLPNRFPDAANYLGLAREISAVTEKPFRGNVIFKKGKERSAKKSKEDFVLRVEDKEGCLRYSSLIVAGVVVKESPAWLKEKLEIHGMRSINNIVDATNYVMLETGQPLHAFDYNKLEKGIVVRRARKGEHIVTLDERDIELASDDLVIADFKKPLALAGIKGGRDAEIAKETTTILLEAANFDPDLIVRTTQRVGFTTDASQRFKYGIDPNMTEMALFRVAEIISKLAGGKVSTFKDVYPKKNISRVIAFDCDRYGQLVGEHITPKDARTIFERLQWKVKKTSKGTLLVEVPTWRRDVERFEDLVEEVVRIYGYDTLQGKAPSLVLLEAKRDVRLDFTRNVKERMAGFGFDEVYSYSFIPEAWRGVCEQEGLVELANPVSAEYHYLRPTLMLPLFRALESNVKFFKQIRMFEVGRVFVRMDDVIQERTKLAGMITLGDQNPNVFYELKGVLEELFNGFGISDLEYRSQKTIWSGVLTQSATTEVCLDDVVVGYIGLVDPRWLERFDVRSRVAVFEIDLEVLLPHIESEHEFVPISKYPDVVRDISFIINREVRIDDVQRIMYGAASGLLDDVDLFDMFEGEKLGEDKKSLSFHLVFRSRERTLTSEEVGHEIEKIVRALQDTFSIELR